MQGEYFNNYQGGPPVPQQGFTYGGYLPFGYTIGGAFPVHKTLDKIKKNKQKFVDNRKYEEVTNSTDESIHLVRSRKTGESAPNRYEVDQTQKKRSQSGNSLGKSSVVQSDDTRRSQQRHHSQSEERSLSPNNSGANHSRSGNHLPSDSTSNRGKNKKRKDRKNRKGTWHFSDAESLRYTENRVLEPTYPYQTPYSGVQTSYGSTQYTGQELWNAEYSSQPQAQLQQAAAPAQVVQQQQYVIQQEQTYYNPGWPAPQLTAAPGYDAPGGPLSAAGLCDPCCYPGYQPQQITSVCPQQPINLPPVPLPLPLSQPGYDPAYCQPYPYPPVDPNPVYPAGLQCVDPNGYPSQSFGPAIENPQQNYIPGLPPGAKIVAEYFLGYLDEQQPPNPSPQQYPTNYPQYPPAPQSTSESSKEDVDIEVWEKSKKKR